MAMSIQCRGADRKGIRIKYELPIPDHTKELSFELVRNENWQNLDAFVDLRIEIPEGIEVIGETLFFAHESLTEIKLPDSAEKIQGNAFSGCVNLRKVKLSPNLKVIGQEAFLGCEGLKEICLPQSIIRIGPKAFKDCYSLKSVEVPKGFYASVDTDSFENCPLTKEQLQRIGVLIVR